MFEDKSGRIKIFQLHKNNIHAIGMGGFSYNVLVVISIFFIFISYCVNAYAQLADTMLCADESCSETISEGEARLAYRPRDKNFLDLKKGQVVLVKSKNAGKKTHLWGGQDFLKGRTSEDSTDESFSHLVAEKQKITFEKSKKIDEQKQQQIADNENRKSPPVEEAVKVVTADSRTKEVDDIDNSQSSEDIQTTEVRSFVEESSDQAAETFEPEDRIKLHDDQLKLITDSVGKQKDDDSMNAIPDIGKTIIDTKISNSDSDNGNIATNIPSDIAALLGEDQTFKKDITTSDSVIVKTKEISAADKSDIINTDNQDIAAKVDAPTDTVDEDDRKKNDDHGDDKDSGGQSDEQEKASVSSDDSDVGPADKFHEKGPQSVPVSEEFVEEYGEATQDNDEVVEEKKADDIIAEDVLTAKVDDEETRESEKDSLDKTEVDEQGFKQMPENVPHTSESIKSNDDQTIKNNMEHEYYESHKVSQTGSNNPVTLPSDNQEGTTELHQEANIEDYQESHQHEYDESTKNELITDIEKKNSENQLQGNNIGKNEKSGSEKHMQDKSLAEQEMGDHGNVSDQEENPHLAEVNQNDLDKNENSDNGQVTTSKVQAKAQEMESSLEDVITDHGIHTKIEDTQSSRENANPNEIQEESRNEDNIIQENDISTITPEEEVKQLVSENTQLEVIDDESEAKKHLTEPPEYHAHSEDSVEREGSLKKTIDTTQDTRPENDSEISSTDVHTDGEHDEKYSNGDSSNPTHKDGEHDEKDFIGDPSTSTHTDGKHDEKFFNGASSTSSRTDVEHDEKDFNGDYSARTNAEHDSNIGSSTSAYTDGEPKHDTDDVPQNIKKDSEPEDGRDEFRGDLQIQQMDTESQQSDDQSSHTKFSKVSVLQMENPDNKDIRDQPLNKAMKEESIEKYDTLHEGKVVNWDETLEEKPNEKHVGWDELLGAENDSPTVSPTSETDGLKVIERYDNPEDEATSTPTTHQSSDQMKKSTELHTETAPVLAQTKNVFDEEQPIKLKETTTTTPIEFSQQSNPSQQYDDQPKNDLHETAEKNKSEEASSPDVNSKVAHDEINPQKDDTIAESVTKFQDEDDDLHVESFSLRLLLIFSKLPSDIVYIMEPLFAVWVSLLPEEYQKDVYGVSWTIIFSTSVIGFILIWLLICRSRSVKRAYKDQHTATTIQELKTQLENLSQEKIEVENELRTKQNEVEIQKEQMASVMEEKNTGAAARRGLEHSLREHNEENDALKREMQILNQNLLDKDHAMQEVLSNSQRIEKSLVAQQEAISKYESEAEQLRRLVSKYENDQKSSEASNDKLKEKIKALEKAKGETKKEGKTLKDQIEKLNNKIGELQENLDNEIEDGEARKQEIDVLKDCILQFKGVQEYLNDEDEDIDTEEAMIKQKEKMKSMIDVANVKNVLRQSEAEKLQVTYELEAERKSRQDTEGKVSELEATIQGNEAMKNKLEREKQMLESKLTVMQEFYAKREVEIQSKLGLEQSKRESNASLLEDQQQQRLELLQQLDAYKKMSEDAKRKYEDSERQHKQEILGFEKKSHENWLACRDSERKTEEANKQISQLQLELTDLRRRLHDSQDREPIIRPRPERHGPPGAPPPFGPPRRGPPPPGVPCSPLHFRSGPPDADRRSPPLNRRPPSPGGSIPGDRPPSRPDRPPSRPDRPPSTHSLPPLDRRSMPGPPSGPGQPYTNTPPGREFRPYRDGMPPMRPPPRDLPPHARPPPPSGPRSGPSSSPYMDRPPIPSSQSPGQGYFTQSSLHATPPQSSGDGLRNDGNQPPPPSSGSSAGPPPPGAGPHGGSNPFRRSRP